MRAALVRLPSAPDRSRAADFVAPLLLAGLAAHWPNGWLARSEASGLFATERSTMAADRLAQANVLLRGHGDYGWLTEHGSLRR